MQTVQQIVDAIQSLPEKSRLMILAPLIRDRKGEYQSVFDDLHKAGYVRVRVDGQIHDLSEEFQLDKNKKPGVTKPSPAAHSPIFGPYKHLPSQVIRNKVRVASRALTSQGAPSRTPKLNSKGQPGGYLPNRCPW